MRIVKVKGGLGNQLFQYAFACLIQQRTGDTVKLDMSSFSDLLNDPIRQPRLLKFNISLPVAEERDIHSLCMLKHKGNLLSFQYRAKTLLENTLNKNYYWEKNRAYIDPNLIDRYLYFDGYWQSWRYVDAVWELIRTELVPNYPIHEETRIMIDRVKDEDSVFVGIRRGDYTTDQNHYGSFGNSYYQRGMDYFSSRINRPTFYVFSNDIPWVKDNIDFSGRNVQFREPESIIDDFEDFLIMASCKHAIIINSTYHWWGARMNDNANKIVIAPRKWFFDDKPIDIIPPHWIRIDA